MEEPTISTPSDERLASTPQALSTTLLRSAFGTTTLLNRWGTPASDQRYVAETLHWIAAELGTKRARFVRLLPSGIWIVQTVAQGKIVAQPADRAEIAMAWSVGLSRDIYSASRPRVMTLDGQGIRPIAVTTYIAIPVLCQQGLSGVIEAAGELKPGAERIARAATERLAEFATRLMFDPGLRSGPRITLDTECEIAAGLNSSSCTQLSAAEWEFIGTIMDTKTVGEIVDELGWEEAQVIEVVRELVARGMITVRTPTGVLMTSTTSLLKDPADFPVPA